MYWRQCPQTAMPYTIQPGDTLYNIALRYNTSTQAILSLNPTINPNNLFIGQVICIPRSPAQPGCPNGFYYNIKQGDTFYAIAKRYGLTVNQLLAANPGVDPTKLVIGQMICVPQPEKCPGGQIYIVQARDTLLQILLKFNISFSSLQKTNPNVNLDYLQAGQQICIPPSIPSMVCPNNREYIIEIGDTLTSIAEKFVISATDLLKVNPTLIPSEFVAGRLICLPAEAPV